ncbi:dihydrofolate reductase [Hypoxylon sp. FL1284]|nr:dihydrofolate reductase [Hypoxylon sp. FL1284]
MAETPLTFPSAEAQRLEPHLPPPSAYPAGAYENGHSSPALPFVTLTYATSLDSALSLGPGVRTALSGPESKAMTHYLRSRHDAICVGAGTAVADDPGLNCRIAAETPRRYESSSSAGVGALLGLASVSTGEAAIRERSDAITARQPRPVVIDPRLRWDFTPQSKVMRLARAGKGLAPYIVTAVSQPPESKVRLLEELGGKFIIMDQTQVDGAGAGPSSPRFDWRAILAAVRSEGLRSIMIEGGAAVINSLLAEANAHLVDSVIVTIAPTWLGQGSVFVAPPRQAGKDGGLAAVARLANTTWMPLGEDVVLCGKIAPRA